MRMLKHAISVQNGQDGVSGRDPDGVAAESV
jgi:hypothetical protein